MNPDTMSDQDYHRFDPDSPISWCGPDRRASNGDPFDGYLVTREQWKAMCKQNEPDDALKHDTDPAPAVPRWPTLELIGLGEALDLVEAVAAFNQPKHPGGKWKTQSSAHQWGKCLSHAGRSMHGEPVDEETGLPATAHAALRLLMALGLELLAAEPAEPTP